MERQMLRVGGDVDAYCTKCRMDLNHTIHAVVNGTPVRVECNTCHGVHRYRAPKSVKEPKAARSEVAPTPKPVRSEKASARAVAPPPLLNLNLEGREAEARPYRFSESYTVGDVLRHTQFGLGIVEGRVSPQKITVLFRAGRKILIDNRSGEIVSES